jgi:signal transduction histidine kinase
MKSRVKLRLFALAAAITMMGLVIAFITVTSERQADELRARLDQKDTESFRIADHFRDFLRQLDSSLFHYGGEHNPQDLQSFTQASHELDLWIDEQQPRLTGQKERDLMHQIDVAYDGYLAAARALQARLDSPGRSNPTMGEYSGVMKESRRLFDLGLALERAHYESRGLLVAHANQTITSMRLMILASLGCLFVLGGLLALVVYRDMIAPMRVQLVESRALAERHEKLASLGMLAAGVAHEIRNPLTAIKAALFMQQRKVHPGSQEQSDAKVVEREILRLERIVNDFLLFAKPAEPELATLQAVTPLREVQELLEPQFSRRGIKLELEESPPLRIRADLAQLKQALINLVQNAADAAGRDGAVKLRARRDRKRLQNSDKNVVVLEVSDNGKGIPPEIQKRLFDPFFTTKDTGTGLGLSIAAGIVEKHRGALQYQTRVDYGTTFGIILPEATE